jgi:hypothetical protein
MQKFLTVLVVLVFATILHAQTSSFTYQGRLTDSGTAANGTYDMQFKLFDNANNQIGSTITNTTVSVSNGVFAVQLDYGSSAFPGADRFLEIGVRPSGSSDPYVILSPRQQLTSTPYAIRSATADTATNATQLNGTAANQYVLTNDPRLTDARTPLPGSNDYIRNLLNGQQAANLSISGDGKFGGTVSGVSIDASVSYKLNHSRVLFAVLANTFVGYESGISNSDQASQNTFVGFQAGRANVEGQQNTFVGSGAGKSSTVGETNSFFGSLAGTLNTVGNSNSFFGSSAGVSNKEGESNAFFGSLSGHDNTDGGGNSFFGEESGFRNNHGLFNSSFGYQAGFSTTTGGSNSFFGTKSGISSITGSNNAFFGSLSGNANTSGSQNTAIGSKAEFGAANLINATAIGANAQVNQSNSLVLGSINGVNDATSDTKVGIGTTTPSEKLTVKTATGNYGFIHTDGAITVGSFVGGSGNGGYIGTKSNHPLHFFVNNGAAAVTLDTTGVLRLATLGAGGVTQLCRNPLNQISSCSSSLRYKTNIQPFSGGLSLIQRLRPITFDWKQGGMHDVGFGAEDVAAVEPLLVIHNEQGQVEGVKYDRISVALVNALQEQQEQIKRQQQEIELLKRIVLRRHKRSHN